LGQEARRAFAVCDKLGKMPNSPLSVISFLNGFEGFVNWFDDIVLGRRITIFNGR
jgi:hypothetical protein